MKSDEEEPFSETVDNSDNEELWLEHGETAHRLYRKLWKEFYDWDAEDCEQTLSRLKRYFLPEPLPLDPPETSMRQPTEDSEWFTIEDWNPRTGMLAKTEVHSTTNFPHKSAPYPGYTTCNSISRNLQSPPDFLWRAFYLPFADDPKFDADKCLRMFENFAWQTEIQDPDTSLEVPGEIIELEVARRLYFDALHSLSFRKIDKLKILSTPLRIDDSAGLIWSTSQRDLLLWPGSQMTALPTLPTEFVNSDLGVYENAMKDASHFCPNLNCLHSRCNLHSESSCVDPPKPAITTATMKDSEGESCDRDCYRTYDLDHFDEDNKWDDEAVSVFDSVIKLVPDAGPCDLAVLCRMPCIEMYVQRLKTFADAEIRESISTQDAEADRRPSGILLEEDLQPEQEEWQPPVKPCHHPGACNQYANCACYNARKRCQRNCRCSKACILRIKGCECGLSRKGKPCGEDSDCPCRRAHRECDPELCLSCDARGSKKGRSRCQNNQIQQARFLPIRVSAGMFGLGAFAETDIPSQKYLGEYFGEIFTENDSLDYTSQCVFSISSYPLNPLYILPAGQLVSSLVHRIQKHTGLNYAFALARGVQLDSFTIGNETRYLNHSSIPNCTAKIIYVNGDPRIVLESLHDIKEGQELFLDYGPHYWTQDGQIHNDDISE